MYFPEAASQSFKAGEMVYLVSGKVTEFTATADTGTARFLGFAAQDATGTTDTRIGVWVPDDDLIFIASMYHGTAANAVTAITDPLTLWPFYQDTTKSAVYPDKANTSGQIDCCRVVGLWADELGSIETVGDIYGQVLFIVEAAGRLIAQ